MLPILTTPRCVLRPVVADDVEALLTLWTRPEVRRYLWDDRVITRDDAIATLRDCLDLRARGLGLWILAAREADQAMVGCAGLLPVSTAAELEPRLTALVEPLVALVPDMWGRGFAHEALLVLLEYARDTLGLTQLAGVTDVPNERSGRMLRRAGFEPLSEVSGPGNRLRTYLWRAEG